MYLQRLTTFTCILAIGTALFTACSPVSEVAPTLPPEPITTNPSTPTEYVHSVTAELPKVEASLAQKGIKLNLTKTGTLSGAARMATSPVEGNWEMIGWIQFPSALFPNCLNEYDYPQYNYTDQLSSIRRYIDPAYFQTLTLTPLQGDGVEIPYGKFYASTNYHYLNINNWSGSSYWFENNTIQSGMDMPVIYVDTNFMVLLSTNRAGNHWYYTTWIRK